MAYFLSSREGNCVNFASALAVMLRSAGVPARFCQGYLGTELDDEGQHLIIRGKDSHAWVEVYFPGYGWIIVEATPGRPADNFDATAPIIPGEVLPPTGTATPAVPGGEIEDSGIVESADPATNNPISSLPWPAILASVLLGIAIISAGCGTIYLTNASKPGAVYARLNWLGRLFRLPARPSETPMEYAHRLGGRLPAEAGDIKHVAAAFARTRYSPEKVPARTDCVQLGRLWRDLSHKLILRRLGLGPGTQQYSDRSPA